MIDLLGVDLAEFRKVASLTQRELAEKTEVSLSTLQYWERVWDGSVRGIMKDRFLSFLKQWLLEKEVKRSDKYVTLYKEWSGERLYPRKASK